MIEYGNCVGVCLHRQSADEVASDMADLKIAEGDKKKKA